MAAANERTDEQQRRAAIHTAAVAVFSAQGFTATSMADIAAAAGMSRPALYQYFANKRDIFASAFAAVIDESVDHSLAALKAAGSVAEQLDGFLQRFDGDLWEVMAASAHSDEILHAKNRVDDQGRVWLNERPDQIVTVVCGGLGNLHAIVLPSWGDSEIAHQPVTWPA